MHSEEQQSFCTKQSDATLAVSDFGCYDVAVTMYNQSMLCGPLLLQVTNVLILDENPEGLEGPWVTYARMVTLRTNKALTGVEKSYAAGLVVRAKVAASI